jgi:hypothetical protein
MGTMFGWSSRPSTRISSTKRAVISAPPSNSGSRRFKATGRSMSLSRASTTSPTPPRPSTCAGSKRSRASTTRRGTSPTNSTRGTIVERPPPVATGPSSAAPVTTCVVPSCGGGGADGSIVCASEAGECCGVGSVSFCIARPR